MPIQPRGKATRQEIIDAAIDLFTTYGYAKVTIPDIAAKAHTTKGAFYYHFPAKADLVEAIHELGQQRFMAANQQLMAFPMGSMERLIRGTFMVADLVYSDRIVGASSELRQSTIHAWGNSVRRDHEDNTKFVSALVAGAVQEGDLAADADIDALLETLNTGVLGVLLAASGSGEPPFARLASMWRVLLPGVVVEDSRQFFTRVVDVLEKHHSR